MAQEVKQKWTRSALLSTLGMVHGEEKAIIYKECMIFCNLIFFLMHDRSEALDMCWFHVSRWEKCCTILSKELVSHLGHEFRFSNSKDIYHSRIYSLPQVSEENNCSPRHTQGIICPQHWRLHTVVNKRWIKDKTSSTV